MKRIDILIVGYSLFLMVGGVIGYFMAGSIASLLMSAIFTILLISALFCRRFWPTFANQLLYGSLAMLTLFFAWRWYNGKFMPPGLLCLFSLAVLVLAYLMQQPKTRQ
jgi:uncharacterized membrane protein (UPF0136 family)